MTTIVLSAGGTGGHLFPAEALSEALTRCGVAIDHDAGKTEQPGFDRQQRLRGAAFGLEFIEGVTVVFDKRADARAPQRCDVAEAAQQTAEIAGDGSHIGALPAVHDELRFFALMINDF